MLNLFAKNFIAERTLLVQDQNGIMQIGEVQQIPFKAILQTADAEVLETLPEGYRTTEIYVLFSDTKLRGSLTNSSNPDIVLLDDDKFQVIKVQNWFDAPCSNEHYEIIIIKIED